MEPVRKIAHVTSYPRQGGTHCTSEDLSALAGYAKSLLSHLPIESRKKQVVLANLKQNSRREYLEDGMQVIECWLKNSPLYAWNILKELLKNKEIKLVHIQHEFNQFGGPWTLVTNLLLFVAIRWGAKRKLCLTFHEVLSARSLTRDFLDRVHIYFPVFAIKWVVTCYYLFVVKIAHSIIVQDPEFRILLREEYFATCPIEIVRIGTESCQPADQESSRTRWKIPATPKTLVFFGTLDWRKGLDLLADAYELLPPGTCQLVLSGGRPGRVRHTKHYQDWWLALEERLKRMPGVHILGFVNDFELPLLFGMADLVVLPYLVPQRVSAVFNHTCSYGLPLIASEVFAAQAPAPMLFPLDAQHLKEKIIWALGEGAPILRESARHFRETNTWTASAATFADWHEKMIVAPLAQH